MSETSRCAANEATSALVPDRLLLALDDLDATL